MLEGRKIGEKKHKKNLPRNDQSSHLSGSLIPLGGQLTYALKTALSSDFGLAGHHRQMKQADKPKLQVLSADKFIPQNFNLTYSRHFCWLPHSDSLS